MRILSVKLFDGKVQTFQPEFTIFGGAAIGDLQVEFPQERGGRKLLHFFPAAVNGKGCYGKNERLAVLLLQQLFTKLLGEEKTIRQACKLVEICHAEYSTFRS